MSGVFEAFTVLSGIAAIVSAYKAAGGHFRFWRSRNKEAKVRNEDVALETSLCHVPQNVICQYDRGSSRLGAPFATGDGLFTPKTSRHNAADKSTDIAKQSLEKALLNFNKTLLECLQTAISGHRHLDLGNLLSVSEATGRETNSILKDLYQRMVQAERIPRNLSPSSPPSDATQVMYDMFWDDSTRLRSETPPVISPMSSTSPSSSSATSEDILAANIARLAQHSGRKAPPTQLNAAGSFNSYTGPAGSSEILRRNMKSLLR